MKKLISGAAIIALALGGVIVSASAASATPPPTEECVPHEAWTEPVPDIEHPAVYETVVVTPAVEGTPAIWANFSPNDQEGTFIGPPTYPVDERGTWHDHGTLPPGQAGEDGVYANGNPDKGGNWFYRQAAVPGKDAVTEQRLVTEAYTEVTPDIFHEAITCDPDPVDPIACAVAGDWYTEGDDLAPVQVAEGLRFQDGTNKAVGIRIPVTGNLQGWESLTFSNTGGNTEFFFRMVISSPEDGFTYKSLSFPGTNTITQDSVSAQLSESISATAERYPNAVITSIGFQTNSAAAADYVAVLSSVTSDCVSKTWELPTFEPSCTTVDGHQWIEGTGVLEVPGDWASTSIAVPFTGTLADIGTVLDIEADPIQYVGLHIDTAEGTIVFEEEPSYGGNLWSTSAWAGVDPGMGYAAFGSIEDYIHLNGDVVVTGIRLLYTSPVASSTTVESFTIGCTVYEFRTIPAQPETVVTTGEWSVAEVTCENEPLDVVQETRTNTMTPYVWDAEAWDWVPGETTSIVETRGYVVTSADLEALDCPVVTPEPTDPPAAKPAAAKPGALAATGGTEMPIWVPLGAAGFILAGGLALMALRSRKS